MLGPDRVDQGPDTIGIVCEQNGGSTGGPWGAEAWGPDARATAAGTEEIGRVGQVQVQGQGQGRPVFGEPEVGPTGSGSEERPDRTGGAAACRRWCAAAHVHHLLDIEEQGHDEDL